VVQHELVVCRVLHVSPLAVTRSHTISYRLLRSFFAETEHWKNYDPFFESKAETYRSSSGAIIRTSPGRIGPVNKLMTI
jgi:hypothetical protein